MTVVVAVVVDIVVISKSGKLDGRLQTNTLILFGPCH